MRAILERLRDASCGSAIQIDYLYLLLQSVVERVWTWTQAWCAHYATVAPTIYDYRGKTGRLNECQECTIVHCAELFCAADDNGRCHLRHDEHQASNCLLVDFAVLHHHCWCRLSRFLRNGRAGLWHRPAARPGWTHRPARHRTVRTIPQVWGDDYRCFFIF